MKNVNKKLMSICLGTLVLGVISISAQAGTSHSLGGHSMVNARNCAGAHNFAGHNWGSLNRSSKINLLKTKPSGNYSEKIANYIRAHGGTVTVNKANNQATIAATTGKGGTLNMNISKNGNLNSGWVDYAFSSTITTAHQVTYSGQGGSYITTSSGYDSIPYVGSSHHGTASKDNKHVDIWGDLETNKTFTGFEHSNSIYGSGTNEHSSTTSVTQENGNAVIDRNASITYRGMQGNTLETKTNTVITKDLESEITTITHPNKDKNYVLYNGQPIIHN